MNKTKIAEIKTTIMNALLGDLRILQMFYKDNAKDPLACMYNNIYPYLSANHRHYQVDNYVYFDVAEDDERYKLIFEFKSHIDIKQGAVYILDKLVEYIQENIMKIYPMCRNFHIDPSIRRDVFVEKRIDFSLYKYEMSATQ